MTLQSNSQSKSTLEVINLSLAYGKNKVVNDVSFQLEEGEIGCLLGPSGCGKTTLLRSIAGFQPLVQGVIYLNGHQVSSNTSSHPPEKRHIGMVFQDFSLFPHLTITDNIGFGIRHLKRSERQQRIKQLLALVSLQGLESRYPHEISGGQQQRIALARALAPKPDLLLLDEPFSSMDIELREELATEVKQILKSENMSALLVTHDQNEAFVVADTIGVMKDGKLLQWSDDYTLYHQPTSAFVAGFIGLGSFIEGEMMSESAITTSFSTLKISPERIPENCQIGDKVCLFIRPNDLKIDDKSSLKATIQTRKFRGADYLYTLLLAKKNQLLIFNSTQQAYNIGESIGIQLSLENCLVFTA